jgi:hypothetical protein
LRDVDVSQSSGRPDRERERERATDVAAAEVVDV